MKKTKTETLTGTITKLADELCRQSTRRQRTEKRNIVKIKKLLTEGLTDLDPGLEELGEEFFKCCTPHLAGGGSRPL